MNLLRLSSVGLCVALAILLAGCGSGHPASGGLSKNEYAAAVTRICSATTKQAQGLVTTSVGDLLERNGRKVINLTDQEIRKLKAVSPPEGLRARASRFIASVEVAHDRLVDVVQAARNRDDSGFERSSNALSQVSQRVTRAANIFGATC